METNNRKQLVTQDNGNIEKIFPKNYMSNIVDEETGESLRIFLLKYNHIDLGYRSSKSSARLAVPIIMRRKGLYITYYLPDDVVITEFFNGNKTEVSDTNWVKDELWVKDANELNVYDIKISDGSITLDKLSEEVMQLISSKGDITINNFPDNEDLELYTIYQDSNNKIDAIRFKDRDNSNGMAYKYLRKTKNMILSQSDFNQANTIYEIRYDFDLNGNTISIPENCELKFVGGSLKNGYLKGNILNKYLIPEWFGAKADGSTDDTKAIQMTIDFATTNCRKVVLSNKTYNISSSIIIPDKFELCTNKKSGDRLLSTVNIVQTNVGSDIIIIKPTSTQPNNINIHDIYLSINDGTPSTNGNGISLDIDIANYSSALQSSIFENIAITNCRYGIYIHTIGYVGIMWNIFRNLNLYRNVIGFYLNGKADVISNRANWFNHNTFVDCHITQNQIGGIYATSRQIETLNITRCNIQECGRYYTAKDYDTFGVNAIKLVGLSFGESKIEGCYFERNYPFTTERITDDQLEIGNNFYPSNMGNNLLVNDIHVTNITTIITGNHFALINPAVTISGNVNLQMFHNEVNIETVTITDNKYIARVGDLNSLGNYSCVTINEPERFNISGLSTIVDVVNIKTNYTKLKYDINVPVFGATYKIIDGVKYEGNINAYIDNQNANYIGSGLSIYNKAKLFNKVLNANTSVLPNSVIKFILNDIYEDRNYVAANNTVLNNAKVIIESTQIDKKWNIGTGFFQVVNTDLVINNINFDFYSTTISAIYFRLYGATNITFNNCTFTGKSSPSNFTLIGCYGTNSTGSVTFNNCTFDKGTAVNSNIRLVCYISGNNNIKVNYFGCTFIGNFSSDGINSDGTLLSKERIISSVSQITLPNIIYKIVSDIDLGGTTLTLPANCTLDFQGGSFSNGTIVGSNTKIIAGLQKIFNSDIILSGAWNIEKAYPEWFGAVGDGITNDTTALTKCINYFTVTFLSARTYITDQIDNIPSFRTIKGCGKKSIIQANPSMELTNNYLLRTKDGGSGIIFSDFVLLGGSSSAEANYKIGGIALRSTSNDVNDQWDTRNIIQNVEIKNCYAASIYVATYQRENKIINCFITHTTNIGINCMGTDNMIIGCTVAGSHLEGIVINGNNRVDSCKCFGCGASSTVTGKYALSLIGSKCNVSNVELQQNNYGGCIIQGNSNYVQLTCDNNGSGTTSTVIGCSVVGNYNTVILTSYNFSFHNDQYERYFVSTNWNTVGNNIIVNGTPLANNKMATISPWSIDNICNNVLWNGFSLSQTRETSFNKYLVPNKYTPNGTGEFIKNDCGLAFKVVSATAANIDVLTYSISIPNATIVDNNGCFSVKARFHKDGDINSILYPVVRIITKYKNSSGATITRTDQNTLVNLLDNKDSLDVYAITSYHHLDDKPISISSIFVEFSVMSKVIASGLAINAYFDDIKIGATTIGNKIAFLNEKGTTSERPDLVLLSAGFKYYDTTLNKYIMSNGTTWTNLDGTALT